MYLISFENSKGQTLRGFVHKPRKWTRALIFLHGFPGSCEGTAKAISRRLVKKGILCLRFDFGGTLTSDGKFEDKLISKEVAEVRDAIDFLEKQYGIKEVALAGTSTGAIVAGLYAHRDKRVKNLMLLGTIHNLKTGVHYDFTDEMIARFKKKGYILYNRPGKWYNRKKLMKAYYDEFFNLDLPGAIRKYHGNLLIIHGSKDFLVPIEDAKKLYKLANRPKEFYMPPTGHSYWGRLDEVASKIASFIA